MVTRAFNSKDMERGKRLMIERKKIWKSRLNFVMDTGIPSGTLENWESRGGDISAVALSVLAERGGDVLYVLTGKRTATNTVAAAGATESVTLTQKQVLVVQHLQEIIAECVSALGRAMQDAAEAEAAWDFVVAMRQKTQRKTG